MGFNLKRALGFISPVHAAGYALAKGNLFGGSYRSPYESADPNSVQWDPVTFRPLGPEGGRVPRGAYALDYQNRANMLAESARARYFTSAQDVLGQGQNLFESYRPGGAAALASGLYGQRAQLAFNIGTQQEAPDLLMGYRDDAQRRAEAEAKKARRQAVFTSLLGMGAQIAGAAAGSAAGTAAAATLTPGGQVGGVPPPPLGPGVVGPTQVGQDRMLGPPAPGAAPARLEAEAGPAASQQQGGQAFGATLAPGTGGGGPQVTAGGVSGAGAPPPPAPGPGGGGGGGPQPRGAGPGAGGPQPRGAGAAPGGAAWGGQSGDFSTRSNATAAAGQMVYSRQVAAIASLTNGSSEFTDSLNTALSRYLRLLMPMLALPRRGDP
jgi:hypothetical protein